MQHWQPRKMHPECGRRRPAEQTACTPSGETFELAGCQTPMADQWTSGSNGGCSEFKLEVHPHVAVPTAAPPAGRLPPNFA